MRYFHAGCEKKIYKENDEEVEIQTKSTEYID